MKEVDFEFLKKFDGLTLNLLLHDNRDNYKSLEKIRNKVLNYLFPKTKFYELPRGREIFEFLFSEAEDIVSEEGYGPYQDMIGWLEKFEDLYMYAIHEPEIKDMNIVAYDTRELMVDISRVESFVKPFYERIEKGEARDKVNKDFVAALYDSSKIRGLPVNNLHEKLVCTMQDVVHNKDSYEEWFFWHRNFERVIVEALRIFKG